MDGCPCRLHDGRRVVAARPRPTVCAARNGPPSQRDLRPAARRPSGGMPGGGGAGNPCRTVVRTGRQLNNNRIAADRSDVWGRRAVKRFLGVHIHDGNWQVRVGHFAYGLDRTRPHHPGRPGASHGDGIASPTAPVQQRDRGAGSASSATDQHVSASSLDRRALAVARNDPTGDRDHSLADVGRFEHLEVGANGQQPGRDLVRPADAKA
jgi:hypothetical protein